ncbi:MAG: alpha/beta hydrolase [Planctomycetaceae bacterium]
MLRALLLLLTAGTALTAAEPTQPDVEYAMVDGHRLLLDIYQPTANQKSGNQKTPLVIWVHGGAWRSGSRSSVPIARLLDHGFAIASVDYRLSPVARFPAQVHDIKAAIRFLRANSAVYNFDSNRFIIAGSSAGGHLAALVGVTNGVPELEGNVGADLQTSSDVQMIVSFFGASNLQTILSQSTPHGLKVRVPALELLLGGQPTGKPELARLASPVVHVDDTDPPLLLIHGDQDPQMPINQAHELHGRYKQFALPVEFKVIHGGAHGGRGFFENPLLDQVAERLTRNDWK